MSSDVHKNITIIIEYGKDFESQISMGEIDALTGINVKVDEVCLTGTHEGMFPIDDYIYINLMKMLSSIDGVLKNKRAIIRYQSVPFDLILEMSGKNVVNVGFYDFNGKSYNPNIPDEGLPVSLDALVVEFIRVAKEFLNRVLSMNPKLTDTDEVKEFRIAIEKAEKSYQEFFSN
ncbi:hypothetical protein [Methanolobus psychrotolerans]|uniref:hypothetical protein n=1 Tax=Methanolobus psychrotolerans TaxID=1874706 RepID=UPI000B9155AC|nr:hypothetical protein [Methanolobus psychrotolerans]